MRAPSRISGPHLRLRPVTEADAAFIHGLRTDPAHNRHLSPVTGTVADQRAWIARYRTREAAGTEVYFIIERHDGVPCGTVRLYDITAVSFTWGSWILNADKPPRAALESAVLSFGAGFEGLGLARAHLDVRRANARAIAFYRRFGMTETGQDADNLYFTLGREDFRSNREAFMKTLQGQSA